MAYKPDHDRCYWRGENTKRLVEAARDSGHELAIALGERLDELEDADDQLADAQAELRDLRRAKAALKEMLAEAEAALDELRRDQNGFDR